MDPATQEAALAAGLGFVPRDFLGSFWEVEVEVVGGGADQSAAFSEAVLKKTP